MKARLLTVLLGVAALGSPALVGCDRTVEHEKTETTKSDGTHVKDEKTVKEKPDGTVVTEHEKSKTNP